MVVMWQKVVVVVVGGPGGGGGGCDKLRVSGVLGTVGIASRHMIHG
jgi:hypothetical protein